MNELEYIAGVSYLLEQRPRGVIVTPQAIQATKQHAFEAVGREIANGSEYALQQKNFDVELLLGIASLSTIPDIISDTIVSVFHPDIDGAGTGAYFSRIPNGTEQDLFSHVDPMNPPYILDGQSIKAGMGNGGWPATADLPPDAHLIVRANFTPDLTTIHPAFTDRVLQLGAEFSVKWTIAKAA